MKKHCYFVLIFWLLFISFGHFFPVKSQSACNDGEFHLFKHYQNGNSGFVNKSGNFVISPKFDNTFSYFIGDITAASVNKLWGVIDKKGNWVIDPKYDRIIDITDHLLIVVNNKKYEILDRDSKVVKAVFDEIYDFQGSLAAVKVSKNWGFIDLYGNIVIEPQFEEAGGFSEGLSVVKKDNKKFYINQSGQKVFQLEPDVSGGIFKEDLALIQVFTNRGFRYGYIDTSGVVVIKPEFTEVAYQFDEGFARFCENDRCGFINKKGDKVIPAKYDYVERFSEGLAHVELNKKSGFINQKGEIVIPMKYDSAGTFECGVAEVEINDKWGFIDKNGRFLFKPRDLK